MALNRREFNKQETMRHIRSVFMTLYAQQGIDGITVGALCKACGIAKSTFYLYFEDKYQVLEAVEAEILAQLREACYDMRALDMRTDDRGKPLDQARGIVRYLSTHGDTLRALLGKHGDPRFSYKWRKDIVDTFMDEFRAVKGNDLGADIACTIFTSSLIGLYTQFLFGALRVTEHEFSIILGNLIRFALFDFEAFAGNA